jgi:hypothetical protein
MSKPTLVGGLGRPSVANIFRTPCVKDEPKGIGNFTPVKMTNLIASTWYVGGNHGVSFKADKIELPKPANCVSIPSKSRRAAIVRPCSTADLFQ